MKRWWLHLVVVAAFVALPGNPVRADDVHDTLRNLDGQVSTSVRKKVERLAESITAQAGRAYFDSAIFPTNYHYDADGTPMGNAGALYNEPYWTVGQGNLLTGIYYTRMSMQSFDGEDLSSIFDTDEPWAVFLDAPVPGVNTLRRTSIRGGIGNMDYDFFWVSAVYGINDRWDVGLAVPVVRLDLEVDMNPGLALRQEDVRVDPPIITDVLPMTYLTNGRDSQTSGIGDVIVRLKWNMWDEMLDDRAFSWTWGVDVKLPTADDDDLLGNGSAAVRFRTQMAKEYDRVIPQLELAVLLSGDGGVSDDTYHAFQYKASLPFLVSESFDEDSGEFGGSFTIALELLGSMSELASYHDVGVSARLGLGDNVKVVGGVRVPYADTDALTTDWTPTVGLEVRW